MQLCLIRNAYYAVKATFVEYLLISWLLFANVVVSFLHWFLHAFFYKQYNNTCYPSPATHYIVCSLFGVNYTSLLHEAQRFSRFCAQRDFDRDRVDVIFDS